MKRASSSTSPTAPPGRDHHGQEMVSQQGQFGSCSEFLPQECLRAAWSEWLLVAWPAWQEMLPQQGPVTVQQQVQEEGPAAMRQRRLLLPPFPFLGAGPSS